MIHPLQERILTTKRLLLYVRRNPGLTASQYGRLLNKPYGTISAALYILTQKGRLARLQGQGATQDKHLSWRYYLVTLIRA